MHCRFFFTVFFVLGVIGGAFLSTCISERFPNCRFVPLFCTGVLSTPTPLEITHAPVKLVGGVPDKEETENLARLKTAKTDGKSEPISESYISVIGL